VLYLPRLYCCNSTVLIASQCILTSDAVFYESAVLYEHADENRVHLAVDAVKCISCVKLRVRVSIRGCFPEQQLPGHFSSL
jgi:hypothetical protein